MEIVKRGCIPTEVKIFTCKTCGTVFKANKSEYKPADQMAWVHDGIRYQCECPVCRKMTYIYR